MDVPTCDDGSRSNAADSLELQSRPARQRAGSKKRLPVGACTVKHEPATVPGR